LIRALSRLFGFKAVGSTVARYLDEGVECLIRQRRAGVDAIGRIDPSASQDVS
jgi:hypothetical protein